MGPGAIIGRSFAADLSLEDGRVSEAHALLSLRGQSLVLFALRGRLRCDGRDLTRVDLTPGQVISLAPEVDLVVEQVSLPDTVLAVEGVGAAGTIARQVLAGVLSIMRAPSPHLAEGVHKEAVGLLFSDGLSWFVRTQGAPKAVKAGDVVDVDGLSLRFVNRTIEHAAVVETVPGQPLDGRVRLVSHFDTVKIWREDTPDKPLVLAGIASRLVAELLAFGGPVRWELVAKAVWGDGDEGVLRHRLDVTLQKVRKRLDEHGIRRDLVSAHRTGYLELVLHPGDQADDQG